MDNNNNNKKNAHHQNRDGLLLRSTTTTHHHQSEIKSPATTSSDFVLQWGNRKRLRCMKVQVKDNGTGTSTGNESASNAPVHRTTVRIDRRVVRSDHNHNIKDTSTSAKPATTAVASTVNNGNGYLNLRQRPASPAHRILRYFFDFFYFLNYLGAWGLRFFVLGWAVGKFLVLGLVGSRELRVSQVGGFRGGYCGTRSGGKYVQNARKYI